MTEKDKKEMQFTKRISAPFSKFHIEADRCASGLSVFVSGIIGITDFSDDSVTLKSHGGRLNISGKRLSVCVYENGTVEIKGKVEDIGIIYGNKN